MLVIRKEEPKDVSAIRTVNKRAFGQPNEANIVDNLRRRCQDLLSLVAIMENQLVGHILFSPAVIISHDRKIEGMGLAPMAVLPEYQRRGIGSKLVESGLATLRETACPFAIVLGHPHYYPRFGFEPASRYAIRSQWDGVPDDAFMILILDQAKMYAVSGVARYRDEFNDAM